MTIDFQLLTLELERVHTRRLALRPAALSDAWPLFEATRNPLFNRHLLWPQPDADQQVIDRLDAIVEAARRGRMTALSAVVKSSGEWVSLFRFLPSASHPEALEMGIWTSDRYWQGRYSLELGMSCVDAAFQYSSVDLLVGAASPDNKSSCKLMALCGLAPTRLTRRPVEQGGELELMEFEITRADWLARSARASFTQIAHEATLQAHRPRSVLTDFRDSFANSSSSEPEQIRVAVAPRAAPTAPHAPAVAMPVPRARPAGRRQASVRSHPGQLPLTF